MSSVAYFTFVSTNQYCSIFIIKYTGPETCYHTSKTNRVVHSANRTVQKAYRTEPNRATGVLARFRVCMNMLYAPTVIFLRLNVLFLWVYKL